MTLTPAANLILSSLTVIGQVIIILAIISFIARPVRALGFIGTHGLWFSFVVALVATLGSLFYSEVAGYEPCKLCWFQRIFMYPQVILFGVALWKRDRDISDYALALSGIGAIIAGYHYLLQRGITPELPCSAVGYSVSCSQVFVMNFGYITIPLMAFTAFALIVMAQTIGKRAGKESAQKEQSRA